jgi:hypothetical protein
VTLATAIVALVALSIAARPANEEVALAVAVNILVTGFGLLRRSARSL